ncbi:MAG: NFACT RNA binding domain-containing protein [Ignavibacteriales bacterium]|nr:NFACT RNA binding domain-containing protein [Ignavibacteriales bacterium]
MISNYYTLRYLAADLDASLRGSEVKEIFCQSKNELLISLKTESGERCLTVSCEPSMNYLFLRSQFNRAKKNSVDVFQILSGRLISDVSMQPADRELVLHCSGDLLVSVRMFGSKANVLLLNKERTVVDSFLHAKELRGSVLPKRSEPEQQSELTLEDFQTRLRSIGTILLPAAIKQLLPFFTTPLTREACYRSHISEGKVVAELNDIDLGRLFVSCGAIQKEIQTSPRARIYSQNNLPAVFSIIPLEHLAGVEAEYFDSVHDAIRVFVGKNRKQKSLLQEKESLVHFLLQGIEKAERTLQKMEQETEALQRAMRYEHLGKLLMAQLPLLQKGMKDVEVEDIYSPERPTVVIKLDQKLTPARNAEYYFDKAKKARAGAEEKLEHHDGVRVRWEMLREFHDRVSDLQTYDQFAEFMTNSSKELKQLGYKGLPGAAAEKREEAPFRIFTVTGGFQVWVGKNSENNDLLTLKFARPNDLWFHARGSSGSHVVLRTGTGKGEPGRRALEETASIAAFYSKMKNARNVPVAMTERKYVRKPRGAPAGTVTIEREKLFFVNPKLPSEAEQDSVR